MASFFSKVRNLFMSYLGINKVDPVFKSKADYYDSILERLYKYRSIVHGELFLLSYLSEISIFSLVFCYDLWITLCDYEKSVKRYQQNYYVRQMYFLVGEFLEDISQYMDKRFQILLAKISTDTVKNDCIAAQKELNNFRSLHEKEFKRIRNILIAHKEHDISKLTEALNSIKHDNIVLLCMDYLRIVERFQKALNDIITYASEDFDVLGSKENIISKYGS